MLQSQLDAILRDLRKDQDVTAQVKQVLGLSITDLPRARRLEFIKAVISEVVGKPLRSAHYAFVAAITAFRDLAQFLQRKEQSHAFIVAAIEKHAVNHASGLCFDQGIVDPELLSSVSELLDNTLARIFGARIPAPKRVRRGRSQASSPEHELSKENRDPQLESATESSTPTPKNHIYNYLLRGVRTRNCDSLLPKKDSATVAAVVTCALVIKLTIEVGKHSLLEVLEEARCVVMPWIRHLQSTAKQSEPQYDRACNTYLKRVQMVFLNECQRATNDPLHVLKTRAYALTLTGLKLNQYSRDLLRCVHRFTRGGHSRDSENVNDIIRPIYEDALLYVSRYTMDDHRWFSEDVSAWLDHVALVWSTCSVSKPIPAVFAKRISALKKNSDEVGIRESCELQHHFLKHGLYAHDPLITTKNDGSICEKAFETMEELVEKVSVPSLHTLLDIHEQQEAQFRTARDCERHGLRRLRFLRVLEPIRKILVVAGPKAKHLPRGAVLLMDSYMRSLLDALLALDIDTSNRCAADDEAIAELRIRLDKMTGACIEAVREISRQHFKDKELAYLCEVVKCIDILVRKHAERFEEGAQKWKSWISGFYHRLLRDNLRTSFPKESPHVADMDTLGHTARLAECCADLWSFDGNASPSLSNSKAEFLDLARGCYVLAENWCQSARTSLKLLSLSSAGFQEGRSSCDRKSLRTYARRFSEDTVLAFQGVTPTKLFRQPECDPNFVLAVIMQYCTEAKQSCSAPDAHRKPVDKLRTLVRVRGHLLHQPLSDQNLALCSQRKLHAVWVSFLANDSSELSSFDYNALSDVAANRGTERCHGHSHVDLFSSHHTAIPCSADQNFVMSKLSAAILALRDRKMDVVKNQLLDAQLRISSVHQLSQDLELLHLGLEIAQWLSAVLATEDFDRAAGIAHGFSDVCRGKLGISSPRVCVLNAYRHVFGFKPWCRWPSSEISKERSAKSKTSIRRRQVVDQKELEESQKHTSNDRMFVEESDLSTAEHRLKSNIIPLMQVSKSTGLPKPKEHFELGGICIDISFDIRTDQGQAVLCDIMSLAASLHYIGSILHSVESFADASYYVQQCSLIVSKSLPLNAYFRRITTALCCVRQPMPMDLDQHQQQLLLEQLSGLSEENNPSRSPLFRSLAIHCICTLSLEAFSHRFTRNVEKAVGKNLRTALDICKRLGNAASSDERSDHLAIFDHRITTPIVELFTETSTPEALCIVKTVEEDQHTMETTKLACVYIMMHYLIRQGMEPGSFTADRSMQKVPADHLSGRVTRSRTRKLCKEPSNDSLNSDLLSRILAMNQLELVPAYFGPQFGRQIWNFHGFFALKEEQRLAGLMQSAGCTFNLRWGTVVKQLKTQQSRSHSRQSDVDRLGTSFDRLQMKLPDKLCSSVDILQAQGCLLKSNCVIVGLSVDQSLRYLVLWRMNSDSTISKRIPLPIKTEASVEGIRHRLEDVLSRMKSRSVKAGHSFSDQEKKEWWEHSFKLDFEMKQIMSDVENEWLGQLRLLLIPSQPDTNPFDEETEELQSDSDPCDVFVRAMKTTFADLDTSFSSSERKKIEEHPVIHGELILVLDSILETIPWESLPILRQLDVGVTRVPSLQFLLHHMKKRKSFVDPRSLFFVVNPDGDLVRTENTFKELPQSSTWSGSFGKASREEVFSAYNSEDIYLYCGHGAGDRYLPAKKVSKKGRSPIALLMGCSSARPRNHQMANSESNGSAVNYLVHGSEAVVGNLWDVGAKDIDRFTVSMLSHWLEIRDGGLGQREIQSLAKSVALARSACHLPYLVGAAAVVMGRPQIWAQI